MSVAERATTASPPPPGRRARRDVPRNRVRIAIGGIVALVILVYIVFTKSVPFVHGYRVNAIFTSSNQLVPGFSPVRIAGVTVGKVSGIDEGPGDTTKVTMELKDSALPLHTDARARIRPRLFLEGGFAVELQPGSPSAPELPDGGTIAVEQTAVPVQFHQILSAFDRSTRSDLRAFIAELDTALDNGGARSFGQAMRPLAPLLRDTARIAAAAQGVRAHDPSEGIRSTSRITAALASRQDDLRALVTALNRTTTALASRDTQLAASIRELNSLVTEAPASLDRIDAGQPALRRFVADLRPSLRAAPPVLDHTAGVLTQLGGLVSARELPRLITRLGPTVRGLPTLETRLGTLFGLVTPVTDCVREKALPVLYAEVPDGSLSSGRPVWQDLAHAFVGLASADQNFDGNGYSIRYLAGEGDTAFSTGSLPGLGQLTGLAAAPIVGSRPTYLGPGVKPAFRPDAPCTDQPAIDLTQRTSGGTPAPARRVTLKRPKLTDGALRRAVAQARRGLLRKAARGR